MRLVLVLALVALPRISFSADLALRDGRILDPQARQIREGTLWLRDGEVLALGDAAALPAGVDPADFAIVDLDGRWVLPLLIDLRVHAGENRSPGHRDLHGVENSARLMLSAGIGAFVDVHNAGEAHELRSRQRAGRPRSARIYVGGPPLSSPGGRGTDFAPPALAVGDLESARQILATWKGLDPDDRPDVISLIHDRSQGRPPLPRPVLVELIEGSRQIGLPCVVEVGTWLDAREALEAGAALLSHLPPGEIPSEVLSLAQRQQPGWIPTLAISLDFRRLLSEPEIFESPLLRALVPEALLEDYPKVRIPQRRYAEGRELQRQLTHSLIALRDAGALILAGSESGSIGTFIGFSLHRELRWLAELGLEPWELLASATTAAGAVLGREVGFSAGSVADFMVLEQSPLEDVAAAERIALVIQGGELVSLEPLREAVLREVVEEGPPSPWEGGSNRRLLLYVVVGFAVLLLLRRWIQRAAVRAARDGQ